MKSTATALAAATLGAALSFTSAAQAEFNHYRTDESAAQTAADQCVQQKITKSGKIAQQMAEQMHKRTVAAQYNPYLRTYGMISKENPSRWLKQPAGAEAVLLMERFEKAKNAKGGPSVTTSYYIEHNYERLGEICSAETGTKYSGQRIEDIFVTRGSFKTEILTPEQQAAARAAAQQQKSAPQEHGAKEKPTFKIPTGGVSL